MNWKYKSKTSVSKYFSKIKKQKVGRKTTVVLKHEKYFTRRKMELIKVYNNAKGVTISFIFFFILFLLMHVLPKD